MLQRTKRSIRRVAVGMVVGVVTALGSSVTAPANAEEPLTLSGDFLTMKYGIFVHYVPGLTVDSSGVVVNDINVLADAFDAQQFANDLESFGVEYVLFAAWHKDMLPLWPSAATQQWRGPGKYSRRDVIGEMITEVSAKGIAVLLYTHPRDGHDMSQADQIATGWGDGASCCIPDPNPSTFDFTRWNNFINQVYAEMLNRYGNRIVGVYVDEGNVNSQSYNIVDYPRLRSTIKSANPNLIMIQNYYSNVYTADLADREFWRWDEFASNDGTVWPAYRDQPVSPVFAGNWWTSVGSSMPSPVTYSPQDMYRYTVLQAGTNITGGGVKWAASPYPGGGWEPGVVSTMTSIAGYIAPVARSIKNTYASSAWVTRDRATIGSLEWGVATRSPDGRHEYIHVLKPPSTQTLRLAPPADGKQVTGATLLANGRPVAWEQNSAGVYLTLVGGDTWNAVDTVIDLTVVSGSSGVTGRLPVNLTASSTVESADWGLSKAADGTTGSVPGSLGWTSSLDLDANHVESLTADLGSAHPVAEVVLFPRTDGDSAGYGLPIDYLVETSDNGTAWQAVATGVDTPVSTQPRVVSFAPVSARYVRITGTRLRANPADGGRYRMQLAEFEVRSSTSTTSGPTIAGRSQTVTNRGIRRLLQGTGDSSPSGAGDRQVAGVPTTSRNPEFTWDIDQVSGEWFSIRNTYTGGLLSGTSVPYRGRTDINRVALVSATVPGDAQLWRRMDAGDGYVKLVNKQYGMQLHMTSVLYLTTHDSFEVVMSPAAWGGDEFRWAVSR